MARLRRRVAAPGRRLGDRFAAADGVRSQHTAPVIVQVPAGTVHQLCNPSDEPATVFWSTRPALRTGEFFVALHEAAGDIERVVAVITEYDDVFCLADHPS